MTMNPLFSLLFVLLCLLCGTLAEDSPTSLRAVRSTSSESVGNESSRRRQLNFWGFVFLADLVHCPPIGPAHHKCKSGGGGGSSTSNNSSNGDGSSSNNNGDGSGNSVSESNSDASGGLNVPSGTGRFRLMMFVAAAVATAVAAAAVVKGQRETPKASHKLRGSVARRIQLFSHFCDSALCNANGTTRPGRVVEMTMSTDDYNVPQKHSALV